MQKDVHDLGDPGTYILAVSGGVDSVVLLDLLVKRYPAQADDYTLIVAHVDHGIRPESPDDAEFVRSLAKIYDLPFHQTQLTLGIHASEARARQARYAFLSRLRVQHEAESIVTGHHQDDVIETAILNLVRGTNRKGLSSLGSQGQLLRPLLGLSKDHLVRYAIDNNLSWREDSTNQDTHYLRNYVRHNIVAKMNQQQREAFTQQIELSRGLNAQIDDLVAEILERLKLESDSMQQRFRRYDFVMLDEKIALELLAAIIRQLGGDIQSSRALRRLWLFIKTASQDKQHQFGSGLSVQIQTGGRVCFSKSNL